jgi:hypothetical protein
MNRAASCGASWGRSAARSSPGPKACRSSLKSQGGRLDAGRCRAFGRCRERHVARGIGVASDVEPAQCLRQQKGGKVARRERGGHRHGRQGEAQRQHRLDALADSEDVGGGTEAHGTWPRRLPMARRGVSTAALPEPSGPSQVRCAGGPDGGGERLDAARSRRQR